MALGETLSLSSNSLVTFSDTKQADCREDHFSHFHIHGSYSWPCVSGVLQSGAGAPAAWVLEEQLQQPGPVLFSSETLTLAHYHVGACIWQILMLLMSDLGGGGGEVCVSVCMCVCVEWAQLSFILGEALYSQVPIHLVYSLFICRKEFDLQCVVVTGMFSQWRGGHQCN